VVVLIVASVGVSETSKTSVVVVCLEGVSEVLLALIVVVRLEGFCVTSLTTSVVVRIEGVDGTVLSIICCQSGCPSCRCSSGGRSFCYKSIRLAIFTFMK